MTQLAPIDLEGPCHLHVVQATALGCFTLIDIHLRLLPLLLLLLVLGLLLRIDIACDCPLQDSDSYTHGLRKLFE